MLLAINYSRPASVLLAENKIWIDRFKVPNWTDLIEEAQSQHPVAVHFDMTAGRGDLDVNDWVYMENLLFKTNTPYINLHLDPLDQDFPGIPIDTTDPKQANRVIDNLLHDVWVVVEHFGAERVIVENVPYRGTDGETMRTAVEPAVIRRILAETGCGLLLDIPHARIASHHLGWEEREYINSLPTDRIRELHFTGLHTLENGRLQDHLSILDTDWPILQWVLEKIHQGDWSHPWLLAFEYGGVGEKFSWRSDPQVMAEQVPLLYEMLMKV